MPSSLSLQRILHFETFLSLMAFCCINSPFDCLLLDLDDTLYPLSTGISQACKRNIDEFLAMKCRLSKEQASTLRIELFKKYGSSLAGLLAHGYDVHPDEYHSFVHGSLPYERIRPNPQLRELLLSIPQAKIMFTNSDRKHASRVLGRLGIEEECFDKIICFETLNPGLFEPRRPPEAAATLWIPPTVVLKPFIAAFEAAIEIAGFEPHRTLFLDDSEKNISAGKFAGLQTAMVGKIKTTIHADYAVETLGSLRCAIPEIWGAEEPGTGDSNDDKNSESESEGDAEEDEISAPLMINELDGIRARPIAASIEA